MREAHFKVHMKIITEKRIAAWTILIKRQKGTNQIFKHAVNASIIKSVRLAREKTD